MRYTVCSLLLLLHLSLHAQVCDCAEKFRLIKREMETNYSGFKDKVKSKGRDKYEQSTKKYAALAAKEKNSAYCLVYIKEWLEYFNDGHVQIGYDNPGPGSDSEHLARRIKNTEVINITPQKLKQLATAPAKGEGIFYSPDSTYKIAIMRSPNGWRDLVGVMLATKAPTWQPGQVKLELKYKNDSSYTAILYYRDHYYQVHKYHYDGNSYDGENWTRENTKRKEEAPASNMTLGYEPAQVRKLSDSMLYIQIGSFQRENTKLIDSMFKAYERELKSTPYLVLDLRHNGGGSDQSYQPIIPYLYTGPFISIGNEVLATEDNIRRWRKYLDNQYVSEETKKSIVTMTADMQQHLGHYVQHATDDTTTLEKIEPYPRKVAVLVNHNCGSTTEQFLLDMRQSKKVTIMGEHTYGELDFSNLVGTDLPCYELTMYYPTSRSRRIEMGLGIDEVGIQPQIVLPANKDWITEARKYLE